MIPTWLRHHLEATGRWDADGIHRAVTARLCRTCHHRVLAGLDDDRCAWPTHADPTPLDPAGEALALLTGRPTYDLTRRGDRYELDHRDPSTIRYHPPGSRPTDVLAQHRCHAPSLPQLPSAYSPASTRTWGCAGDPPF